MSDFVDMAFVKGWGCHTDVCSTLGQCDRLATYTCSQANYVKLEGCDATSWAEKG